MSPEYPSQSRLIAARDSVPTKEEYETVQAQLKKVSDDLGRVFDEHDISLIVGPTDSRTCSLASASGKFQIKDRTVYVLMCHRISDRNNASGLSQLQWQTFWIGGNGESWK